MESVASKVSIVEKRKTRPENKKRSQTKANYFPQPPKPLRRETGHVTDGWRLLIGGRRRRRRRRTGAGGDRSHARPMTQLWRLGNVAELGRRMAPPTLRCRSFSPFKRLDFIGSCSVAPLYRVFLVVARFFDFNSSSTACTWFF